MKQGVFLSLSSSILLAVLLYYSAWLTPLQGMDIFAWRVIMSLPFFIAILIFRKNIGSFIQESIGLLSTTRSLLIIITLYTTGRGSDRRIWLGTSA